MAKNTNMTRKGIVKFDPDTAKVLPISTGRTRTKGWTAERTYNGLTISIEAFESLNGYDLLALFQMLDDYQKKPKEWKYQGKMQIDDESERILMRREFDLKQLCKQRNISTHKNNRKSIAESFDRWYKAELRYQYENQSEIKTRYIFEYKIDKEFNKAIIVANTNFLDLCLKSGMAMNWERLTKYGKSQYGLELDIYMQFRAIQITGKKGKYRYPNVVKEQTLFNHIGIEREVRDAKEKRRKLKNAFDKFYEVAGQKYILQKLDDEYKWINENYLKYLEKKRV